MPVSISKKDGGKYRVSTPHGTKARGTTLKRAKAQERLLNAVEHGWRPTGARAEHSEPTGEKSTNLMGKGR